MAKSNSIIATLGLSFLLVACGGESDSSGNFELPFAGSKPSCKVSNTEKTIIVGNFGCKVNVPELINNRTFILDCSGSDNIYITAKNSSDLKAVKKAINTNTPYRFSCRGGKDFLVFEQCMAEAKTRLEKLECTSLQNERQVKS